MKKIITYLVLVVFIVGCDTESANDCIQASGAIIKQEITVASFTEIRVNRDVSLVLTEGAVQKVEVETGGNLINDIELIVVNNRLTITEHNTCNFVRDYNVTTVHVTVPNITKVLSSTQFQIRSNGLLNYSDLTLSSEDFTDTSVIAVGDVNLQVNAQNIKISANNLTKFTLSGNTENLDVSFASGDGIFDGTHLISNSVSIFHRGSNDIIVNPQNELIGVLRSTGDIIAKNHPPIVDIDQFYTGELLFE